jgi:hypothetical protein
MGAEFRADLGTDSGLTWAPIPGIWAPIPEHLGTQSAALGQRDTAPSGHLAWGRDVAITPERAETGSPRGVERHRMRRIREVLRLKYECGLSHRSMPAAHGS